jgi:hypothetical protein
MILIMGPVVGFMVISMLMAVQHQRRDIDLPEGRRMNDTRTNCIPACPSERARRRERGFTPSSCWSR